MEKPNRFWGADELRDGFSVFTSWIPLPNINPSIVSFSALPLSVGFVLLWPAHSGWAVACLVLVFLADMLDGSIAKRYHRASAKGWWIDSLTDRASEFILFCTFGPIWIALATLNLVVTFVSYRLKRNFTLNYRALFAFYLFVITVILPQDLRYHDTVGVWIATVFWFFLPIGLANITPFFVRHHLQFLDRSIDFGVRYRGRRIFGDHKTIRGLLVGILTAWLVFLGQRYLYVHHTGVASISLFDYTTMTVWLGVLMGAGALIGDAIESFFKRQRGFPPGAMWFPWDKLDFLIGGVALAAILYWPGWGIALGTVLMGFLISIVMDHIGFYLKMRPTRW